MDHRGSDLGQQAGSFLGSFLGYLRSRQPAAGALAVLRDRGHRRPADRLNAPRRDGAGRKSIARCGREPLPPLGVAAQTPFRERLEVGGP
jgi:hypothetical protein